jgi:osmotically-inducible protein OsmY
MLTKHVAAFALLTVILGGCSDTDHNGQPDTFRPEVRKAAGKALDAAVKQVGKAADNARLAGSIRQRLEQDRMVGLYRLRVEVSDGVATLTGEVNTAKEKAQAERLARKQDGVTAVVNRIEARSGSQ